MNNETNTNYLTNSFAAAKQFASKAADALRDSVYQSKYGYGVKGDSVLGQLGNAVKSPTKTVAAAIGDALGNKTQGQVWKYTNVPRIAGEIGKKVAQATNTDPLTGLVITSAAPLALMTLSNVRGPVTQGLRPAGYKAVAPKSKEEDPTGRTPQSIPLEFALRSVLGQRSQLLPYAEFKKERPDVAPSTYSQYRRYERAKPAAGQLVSIDPEGQSFSTIGGLLRGSAKGLNDPEVRIKGMPITLSGALGTAAFLGTTGAIYANLPQHVKEARTMQATPYDAGTVALRKDLQGYLDPLLRKQNQLSTIIERVENEMRSKNIPQHGNKGPLATKEALETSNRFQSNAEALAKYQYAHGRATGVLPDPTAAKSEEMLKILDNIQPTADFPQNVIDAHKQAVTAYYEKRHAYNKDQADLRDALGIEKKISFSSSEKNVKNLQEKIGNLKQERESLINAQKEKLRAMEQPSPEAVTLQDRLKRASRKLGEVSGHAKDVEDQLRGTYRPLTVKGPSTAAVAGVALAGAAAAIGTTYVARKLMQKAADRRLKKENPVEYLKHKHGSLEAASAALNQPTARSWQQLVPYVQ